MPPHYRLAAAIKRSPWPELYVALFPVHLHTRNDVAIAEASASPLVRGMRDLLIRRSLIMRDACAMEHLIPGCHAHVRCRR